MNWRARSREKISLSRISFFLLSSSSLRVVVGNERNTDTPIDHLTLLEVGDFDGLLGLGRRRGRRGRRRLLEGRGRRLVRGRADRRLRREAVVERAVVLAPGAVAAAAAVVAAEADLEIIVAAAAAAAGRRGPLGAAASLGLLEKKSMA